MFLLGIFSFAFSFFILWNTVLEFIQPTMENSTVAEEDSYEILAVTKEADLIALSLSAVMNLGWMGYVCYTVHTAFSSVVFAMAPLLFAAEALLVVQAKAEEVLNDSNDMIANGIFFIQVYFALIYLLHCADGIWQFLSGIVASISSI
ncbi:putative membrane protein [Propionispora sp. 2/2-37]|uniref:hypothetical protein n=1 Tax=Propionispora sp. 2/2-37 TaxID=1677858 RepID=UPI0006BB637B|nr:hypothetical protein [Propionispora sp. 2/2-37]CUH97582.1 putative membrane protein [Propionispora sp. 2/2-37]